MREPVSQDPTPEEALIHHEQLEALRSAVSQLPTVDRLLVRLFFGWGCHPMSAAEIAEVAGKTEDEVNDRIDRSVVALRELMS